PGHRVPGPVGGLEVLEDDAGVPVLFRRRTPDVEVAPGAPGLGAPGALEPGVLVGGVVEDQLGDDPQPPPVGLLQQSLTVVRPPVPGVRIRIISAVVAGGPQRRRVKRQQPQRGDPEVLQVVEFLDQPAEIPLPVTVTVAESPYMDLIEDGVFVPQWILFEGKIVALPSTHRRAYSLLRAREIFARVARRNRPRA